MYRYAVHLGQHLPQTTRNSSIQRRYTIQRRSCVCRPDAFCCCTTHRGGFRPKHLEWHVSFCTTPVSSVRHLRTPGCTVIQHSKTTRLYQWRIEKNVKRGRQFISSVLIYRKCAQRNTYFLHGKSGFLKKKV